MDVLDVPSQHFQQHRVCEEPLVSPNAFLGGDYVAILDFRVPLRLGTIIAILIGVGTGKHHVAAVSEHCIRLVICIVRTFLVGLDEGLHN